MHKPLTSHARSLHYNIRTTMFAITVHKLYHRIHAVAKRSSKSTSMLYVQIQLLYYFNKRIKNTSLTKYPKRYEYPTAPFSKKLPQAFFSTLPGIQRGCSTTYTVLYNWAFSEVFFFLIKPRHAMNHEGIGKTLTGKIGLKIRS